MLDICQFSDQENLNRCLARAIEWNSWPAFLSQPVAPVLYYFFPWEAVLAGLVAVTVLWLPLRYPLANFRLATLGCYFVKLKWPAIISIVVMSLTKGKYTIAALSVLTPIISAAFAGFTPGGFGTLQRIFMRQLGYARVDDPDAESEK